MTTYTPCYQETEYHSVNRIPHFVHNRKQKDIFHKALLGWGEPGRGLAAQDPKTCPFPLRF